MTYTGQMDGRVVGCLAASTLSEGVIFVDTFIDGFYTYYLNSAILHLCPKSGPCLLETIASALKNCIISL